MSTWMIHLICPPIRSPPVCMGLTALLDSRALHTVSYSITVPRPHTTLHQIIPRPGAACHLTANTYHTTAPGKRIAQSFPLWPGPRISCHEFPLDAASATARGIPLPRLQPCPSPSVARRPARLSVRIFLSLSSCAVLFLPASWRFPYWPSLLR